MKVSVAMIVKNEEAMLARCLETVKEADEIIICDTGSEDKTIEVAKQYTDKVYDDFKWIDHFGKARQHAKDKCTGDWILSIDADEVLEGDFSHVREIMQRADDQGYKFVNVDVVAETSGIRNTFPRIFKNVPEVQWRGAAHNYLIEKDGEERKAVRVMPSDVVIRYGYSPAHKADPNRTLRILRKAVDDNPDLVRERFYLAREYFYRKKWDEAITELDEYIKRSKYIAERNEAWLMRAKSLAALKKYSEACDSAWQAIKYNANFKEALEFIGNHMDAVNGSMWKKFAEMADNRNVLFVRGAPRKSKDFIVGKDGKLKQIEEPLGKPPMDLHEDGLFYFKNLLQRYKKIDVLEWGSGHSTRYFPEYLQSLDIEYTWKAMEHHEGWYQTVKNFNTKNVEVVLADKDSKEYLEPGGKYDLIYIDGRNRAQCLLNATKMLKKGGVVLLHDAQRERYHEAFKDYYWKYIGYEEPLLWHGQLHEMKVIPNIIHQIWLGPLNPPEQWMETWKEKNPNSTYMLWNEKEIEELGLQNKDKYDEYMKMGVYNGASNVARVEILKKYGGLYIDADSECLVTIENAPFMAWDLVASWVVDSSKRIANSPMGCTPNHEMMDKYIEKISKVKELTPSFEQTGPELFTKLMQKRINNVLPAYQFLPIFHKGYKNAENGVMYSNHYWDTTYKQKLNEDTGS